MRTLETVIGIYEFHAQAQIEKAKECAQQAQSTGNRELLQQALRHRELAKSYYDKAVERRRRLEALHGGRKTTVENGRAKIQP